MLTCKSGTSFCHSASVLSFREFSSCRLVLRVFLFAFFLLYSSRLAAQRRRTTSSLFRALFDSVWALHVFTFLLRLLWKEGALYRCLSFSSLFRSFTFRLSCDKAKGALVRNATLFYLPARRSALYHCCAPLPPLLHHPSTFRHGSREACYFYSQTLTMPQRSKRDRKKQRCRNCGRFAPINGSCVCESKASNRSYGTRQSFDVSVEDQLAGDSRFINAVMVLTFCL